MFDQKNAMWARLIDGRSIHFFLMFAEPTLEVQQSSFFLENLADSRAFENAMRILQMCGFHFWTVLSEKHSTGSYEENTLSNQLIDEPIVDASLILEYSVGNYFDNWKVAEKRPAEDLKGLDIFRSIFIRSVVCELHRRISQNVKSLREDHLRIYSELEGLRCEFIEKIISVRTCPILMELVCAWFPAWERYRFIFGSIFDHCKMLPLDEKHYQEGLNCLHDRVVYQQSHVLL